MAVTRASIAADINAARAMLHEAGAEDRARTDFYGADAEDPPAPATEADVDAVIESWIRTAQDYRAHVAKHGDNWPEHVRQRCLVQAEELEWRHAEFTKRREAA